MSALWGWIVKLIGGWIPIGTKPFPEWLGKVLWAVGIYIVCTIMLNHFFPNRPNTTIVQGNQVVQQAEPRDVMGFGCSMWRGYIRAGMKQ